MGTNSIIGVVGTVVGIISLAYAIYANRQLARLEDYNREQAWDIYRQVTHVLSLFQDLERVETGDKTVIEKVAKGEATSQELAMSCISMIKRFEKKFDLHPIDQSLQEGKLPYESHVGAFKSFA